VSWIEEIGGERDGWDCAGAVVGVAGRGGGVSLAGSTGWIVLILAMLINPVTGLAKNHD